MKAIRVLSVLLMIIFGMIGAVFVEAESFILTILCAAMMVIGLTGLIYRWAGTIAFILAVVVAIGTQTAAVYAMVGVYMGAIFNTISFPSYAKESKTNKF